MKTTLLRRGALMALAMAFSTSVAAAQSRTVVDPTTVPELKAEFDRAEKIGLPVDLLVATARKGYLTAAPVAQIRDRVHETAQRLATAREALKPVVNAAELLAGASAIQSGVSERSLRELRAARRGRSLAVPIGALEDLVVRGVPPKQAADRVLSMIKKDLGDVQVAAVAQNVLGDIEGGLAPSLALDVRSRGVLSLPQVTSPAPGSFGNRPPPR